MSRPLKWLIRNKLHVAACSLAATWGWGRMMGTPILAVDLLVVPVLVLSIYQWNRLTDVREDAVNCPDELAAAEQARGRIRVFCLLGALLALGGALLVGRAAGALVVLSGLLLGWLYGFRSGAESFGLKRLFGIKNVSSAFGWTLVTVLYPGLHSGVGLRAAFWLAAACMFLAVWTVEVLWDIRDVRGDTVAGVPSFPVVLGVPATKRLALAGNLLIVVLVGTAVMTRALPGIWALILVNPLLTCVWLRLDSEAARGWSHLLVLMQTLLLFGLGVLSG
ncbi:MAG TPA: UbiA family prenyltransferase [Archangium sp.]|uniref:UbiA family prenyltransferase n=1 Tax=Archangium sp. TaxID=1872627 RepID=UPI002E320E7C|nr:UbiA family prenyltransferase [Archangium sp.]HEX5752435.1 UbiA family prenyltransferase [Archangium sp.]